MEYFSGSIINLLLLIIEDWKLIILLSIVLALYFYYTATFCYFEKKGIPYKKPVLFSHLDPRVAGKLSFHELQLEIYNYFKGHPYGGHFEGRKPVLNIFDPELIKSITIRDFDYFTDRVRLRSNEPKYISRSLVNLKGADWKGVRNALTPVFSSSRLRNMLPLIELCSLQMVQFLKQYDKKEVEMKHTMGHFTLEVIGACAFGIKCDALNDENAHFFKVAEKYDYMPVYKRMIISFCLRFMPQMIRFLPFSLLNTESTEELVRMLQTTKAERRQSCSKKSDFLQILIDFADKEKTENKRSEIHLDDDTIDAQLLLFLIGGYDTSSSLLSFAIHVLATKPELQEKLRANVAEMTEGKEMSYELIAELSYLEAFLLETLRMYPSSARIGRMCTKPYVLPGTSVQLTPGDMVTIPVYGIHMDPDIYPDPNEFRPERFMGEEKNARPPHLYFAFGSGPRNCIGLRFATISAKLAMVSLLKNFKFSKGVKTQDPVEFVRGTLVLKAKNGLWVRIDAL